MAYSADTFVADEQPTTAKWNKLWTNDASFNDGTGIANLTVGATTAVKNSYKFRVYRNAAQNTTAGTTKVLFDTKTYDTGTNFDVATNNRFTAPVAGFYNFSSTIQTVSTTNMQPILYKNGSIISNGVNAGGNGVNQGSIVTDTLQLAVSDYVEVFVQAAAVVALFTGSAGVYFSGSLVITT